MNNPDQPQSVTLEEIYHQGSALNDTLARAKERLMSVESLLNIDQYTTIVFTGCGSSHHLGRCAAYGWSEMLERPIQSVQSSELMHFSPQYLDSKAKPLVFAISRTGGTTEVKLAADLLRMQLGAIAIAIVSEGGGPVSSACQAEITFPECHERSIVMTQAFTCMLAGLYILADRATGGSRTAELEKLPQLIIDALPDTDTWLTPVARDARLSRFFFLGSGPMRGVADECALKMTEMALEAAWSHPLLEFRHGPKAALDQTAHVMIFPVEAERPYLRTVLSEIASTGATVTIIERPDDQHTLPISAHRLRIADGDLPEVFRPALYAHIGQLFAYRRAEARGINPDTPRHLDRTVMLSERK